MSHLQGHVLWEVPPPSACAKSAFRVRLLGASVFRTYFVNKRIWFASLAFADPRDPCTGSHNLTAVNPHRLAMIIRRAARQFGSPPENLYRPRYRKR
eukprot:6120347-Amphidinium_carterae.1